MSERTTITCDGCDKPIDTSTGQAAVTMFIDGRRAGVPFGQRPMQGNFHCCSIDCLHTFAVKALSDRERPRNTSIKV